MKIYVKFLILLTLILVMCGCGKKSDGFKREYRMQVNVGPSTYWGMGAAKFAELVKEKTKGKVNIKPYYGSQLLKGAQLNSCQMVANGTLDCAFESTINTAPVINEMNIFTLPFFINTYQNLDRIENGETGKIIFNLMKEKGLMPLAWGENGFRQLTNNRRSIKTPEDLKGLKVRVVGSPIFIDIFRQFGADPINMNWGDAVTAFQQGTVDGQENPVAILLAVKIWQYHKQILLWNYVIDPLILYWNKEQWDAFPTDIRQAIQEAAEEAARFEKALCRIGLDNGESLKILKDEFNYKVEIAEPLNLLKNKGMKIARLTPEQLKKFKDRTQPVFDKWAEKIGKRFVETAQKDMTAGK